MASPPHDDSRPSARAWRLAWHHLAHVLPGPWGIARAQAERERREQERQEHGRGHR